MPRPSVRLRSVFFLFVLALGALPASAWGGSVAGRVVDPDGRPVAGAQVIATGSGLPLVAVTTGKSGEFRFDVPRPARLTIRVVTDGFRAASLAIDLPPDRHDVGDIKLAISAVSESVVVSAAQVETPLTEVTSSVTVISRAEIESRQLHSVADALRTVPGLTVASTGTLGATTGVFPRGGESNYTLVVIDGVPANAFGGDFDFGHLGTSNIERIEVVRGPQSALFGANAIGAIVRIVTQRGGPPSGQVAVETGQFGASRVSASTAGHRDAFEWGASFDRLGSDGQNGETTAAGETVANDDYTRRAGSVSAGWRWQDAWVRGDVHHAVDARGFPGPFGSNPIDAFSGIDTVARGDNQRTIASLGFMAPLSRRVDIRGQAGYNRIDSEFASQFGGSDAFSRRWSGRAQSDVALAPGLDLTAGMELQRERAGSTFITGASAQEIPVRRTTAGYFGEARWTSRDRLFVVGGVRVEDIRRERIEESPNRFSPRPVLPSDSVVSVNPRLSAAWLVSSGSSTYTKVRAGAGTGIRPPDGFELAFTDNPGLRPERSASVEAGVDQAFAGGHGLFEATAFANDYDDLIVAVGSFSGSSRFRTDNISNARARGLELALTLRQRLAARRPVDISGRFGYTLLATRILAVDQDEDAPPPFEVGQALLRRPKHQFFAEVTLSASRLSAFFRGGGRGTVLDVEPTNGTFGGLFDNPGYSVWNAGVTWSAAGFVDVFGRIENVFDRDYEEALGFPALGRRATVGLRIAAGR